MNPVFSSIVVTPATSDLDRFLPLTALVVQE